MTKGKQDVYDSMQPTELDSHEKDYNELAWKEYTFQELGNAIHFFAKRSGHRSNREKRLKDLYDARNYLSMMDAKMVDLENRGKD